MQRKLHTQGGAKAQQRNDSEWRDLPYLHWRYALDPDLYGQLQLPPIGSTNPVNPYSKWHREVGKPYSMLDVDFVEWRRKKDGTFEAVAVMEVTRVDNGKKVDDSYKQAILDRYNQRDLQGTAAREIANALHCRVFIILFRENCSEFWVYNLTHNRGWWDLTEEQMKAFIQSLKRTNEE